MNTTLLSFLLASAPWPVQLDLAGANPHAIRSESNGRVRYSQVYPGVHLESYRSGANLEYDFIVEPNADPRRIAMRFGSAVIEPNGDLVADGARHHAPVTYQMARGKRHGIPSRFVRRGAEVGFEVGAYDPSLPLIIDPVVTSSRLVNTSVSSFDVSSDAAGNFLFAVTRTGTLPQFDQTSLIKTDPIGVPIFERQIPNFFFKPASATDTAGNIYLAGPTRSGCPANSTRIVGSVANPGVFLLFQKLTPDGLTTLYLVCVQLQGASFIEDIQVDSAGNAYIAGFTTSGVFPATFTQTALQAGSNHAFVTKVDASGSSFPFSIVLVPGTQGKAVALDPDGSVYLGGFATSAALPTVSAAQPNFGGQLDAFLVKLNQAGTQILFATYLGGAGQDLASDLGVDTAGNVVLVGDTRSTNFPVAGSAATPHPGGFRSAFITRFNRSSGAITSSTCVPDSLAFRVAFQPGGEALVTGNQLQSIPGITGPTRLFAAKIDLDGRLIFRETIAGGSGTEVGLAIVPNATGFAVAGATSSPEFSTTGGPAMTGPNDGFVAVYTESADLRLFGPTGNTVRTLNFGPDTATSVELHVGIFHQVVLSMDSRCSIVNSRLAVCKLGTLLPAQQAQVTFVTTGSPSFQVKSSVFDPNLANNQN